MATSRDKAAQACRHCRRLKRKCTRDYPACSLCVRLRKTCEYPAGEISDHPSSNAGLAQRFPEVDGAETNAEIASLCAQALVHTSDRVHEFPASYFLDSDFFSPLDPSAFSLGQRPLLGTLASWLQDDVSIRNEYLATVHAWWPMISWKRLLSNLDNDRWRLDDGEALFLLSMKLLTERLRTESGEDARSSLYGLAKTCCFAGTSRGTVSLRMIQSLVLIALYEIGHCIYPAAYLTIGEAARLGGLIGLQNRKHAKQLFRTPDTTTLREEQRRTWWAVFILDKYVNIATVGMPLSVAELSSDELLPVNDEIWDQGGIGVNEPLLTTSFYSASGIGPFARLCQSAHILSKVLRHREHKKQATRQAVELLLEARQLHTALATLDISLTPAMISQDVGMRDAAGLTMEALSLCSSARLILANLYGCNEPEVTADRERIGLETEMQQLSIESIRHIAETTVPRLASDIVAITHDDEASQALYSQSVSPLTAHCLYHTATECAWFIREGSGDAMYKALQDVVTGLQSLSGRWKVAKEYMLLLEKGETSVLQQLGLRISK